MSENIALAGASEAPALPFSPDALDRQFAELGIVVMVGNGNELKMICDDDNSDNYRLARELGLIQMAKDNRAEFADYLRLGNRFLYGPRAVSA